MDLKQMNPKKEKTKMADRLSAGPRPAGWILGGIILLGAVIRLVRINATSLWYDELYTVWSSRLPISSLVREVIASGHPPLYYLIGHVWFTLGSGDGWLRMISFASGVAIIYLTYLIGYELFSRRAALWAAALASVSPILVWYSRDTTSYSFATAVTLFGFYWLIRGARQGTLRNWAIYMLAMMLTLLTTFFGFIILFAATVFFWFIPARGGRRTIMRFACCQAFLLAAAAGLSFVAKTGTAEGWMSLSFPKLHLIRISLDDSLLDLVTGWVGYDYTNTHAAALGMPVSRLLVISYLCLAAVVAVVMLTGRRYRLVTDRKVLGLGLYSAILVGGPAVYFSMEGQNAAIRYFVWAAPTVFLMLAGIFDAASRKSAVWLGGAALVVLLSLTAWQTAFLKTKGDWRSIMGVVARNEQPGDYLYCFPLHLCTVAADHYLPDAKKLKLEGGMPSHAVDAVFFMPPSEGWTGYQSGYFGERGKLPPLSGGDLNQRIQADLSGAGRVWLINEDNSFGPIPPVASIQAGIDSSWREVQEWDLSPQVIRLYERR